MLPDGLWAWLSEFDSMIPSGWWPLPAGRPFSMLFVHTSSAGLVNPIRSESHLILTRLTTVGTQLHIRCYLCLDFIMSLIR